MIKKQISKISMLASLLVASTINAQEFYTCVPKKSWWKDVMTESVEKGIRKGNLKGVWKKIIHLTPTSPLKDFQQPLYIGKYRLTAAAAGGSEEIRYFNLDKETEFKACVGAGGGGGGGGNRFSGYCGGGGGGGGGRGYGGYYSGGNGGSSSGGSGGYGIGGEGGSGGFSYAHEVKSGRTGKGGKGGGSGGNGSDSSESGGHNLSIGNEYGSSGKGYGKGVGGKGGNMKNDINMGGGGGGSGCGGGGGGGSFNHSGYGGAGGGGGGSYFQVADVELVLKGGDGKPADGYNGGGDGAGPDGYVIVEKME